MKSTKVRRACVRCGRLACVCKQGERGSVAVKAGDRAHTRHMDRLAALKFLRRALREAEREHAAMTGALDGRDVVAIGTLQRDRLWRVVVAASHKSGRFER